MPSLNFLSSCLLVTLALAGCSSAPTLTSPAPADSQATGGNQGIAAGEPAPGGAPNSATAILTPCRSTFMKVDTNGDGWVDLGELEASYGAANKAQADADFKAKDADGNGKLDNGEFGCLDTAPNGGTPTGKG
ncbi:MAG TPA: hypothetical protein V6D47_10130 [Oscillatoriaceae cyanobacterium]